jgi:replication-associated recombination protein RarA
VCVCVCGCVCVCDSAHVECSVNLAQCVVYLARAPKSIAVYAAMKKAQATVAEQPNFQIPMHIRHVCPCACCALD